MKISVLVPTLGERLEEIERLLKSLLNQTYKDFEIIFITQDNHEKIKKIIAKYSQLDIIHIITNKKGLSRARNEGLKKATGDIIVLSDDDCWYKSDAFKIIINTFMIKNSKFVLTQIYDPYLNEMYKDYNNKEGFINQKIQLMSKSSIEIAYRKDCIKYKNFDNRLGLGSEFICGEEVDFLVNNFERKSIYYKPIVTVYHQKKKSRSTDKQIIAKGALYGKNFNIMICLAVLVRDLIKKKQNNFKLFMEGYREYNKGKN